MGRTGVFDRVRHRLAYRGQETCHLLRRNVMPVAEGGQRLTNVCNISRVGRDAETKYVVASAASLWEGSHHCLFLLPKVPYAKHDASGAPPIS